MSFSDGGYVVHSTWLRMAAAVFPLLASGFLVSASLRNTQAQNVCDATILKGSYAISFTGTATNVGGASNTPTVWRAEIGILTFDGAGNYTGTDTYNYGGAIFRYKLSGTYSVNSDCTGSISANTSNTTPVVPWANGDIVILSGGHEVNFVQTDVVTDANPSAQVFSGVMKLRSPVATTLRRAL
jgi:hypothetical protein